jgi:hypothetical protein
MLCEQKDVVTWRLEISSIFSLGSRKPTRTSGGIGQAHELEDSHLQAASKQDNDIPTYEP